MGWGLGYKGKWRVENADMSGRGDGLLEREREYTGEQNGTSFGLAFAISS
jgi:hypothetical protein